MSKYYNTNIKGISRTEAILSNARPDTNGSWISSNSIKSILDGNAFHARPMKQWRHQLMLDSVKGGTSSKGLYNIYQPSGSIFLGGNVNVENNCCFNKGYNIISNISISKNITCCRSTKKYKPATTILNKNYYTTNIAYLKSRVRLYSQRNTLSHIPNIDYDASGNIVFGEFYSNNSANNCSINNNIFDSNGVWRLEEGNIIGAWIQLELPNSIVLHSYQVNTNTEDSLGVPTQFKLEGSNDNFVTSVLLNTTTWGQTEGSRTIIINPPVNQSFKYFRLTNLADGHSTNYIEFNYPLIFFEKRVPDNEYPPIAMTANSLNVTGNTYGNGNYIASSSANGDLLLPFNAFNDTNTQWRSSYVYPNPTTSTSTTAGPILGEWIQLQLPNAIKLKSFVIKLNSISGTHPNKVKLLGSNNPANAWNILYEADDVPYSSLSPTTIYVNASELYSYYRLVILTGGGSQLYVNIVEMQFFEEIIIPYPPSLLSYTLDTTELINQSYGNGVYNISYNQEYISRQARNPIIIYKPNNHKFSIQGAVSSSSRIDKLKLDTINKNKASLKKIYN